MSAHQPGTPPAPTVWHCFQCSDARAVIDWLVEPGSEPPRTTQNNSEQLHTRL
nr:hypothetical protein [Dietzia maris]